MPFRDGLGERVRAQEQGAPVERLRLRPELAAVPSFEFALRERVSRLSGFKHPSFARARAVERTDGEGLTLVSDEAPGVRLSDLLVSAAERSIPVDIGAALALARQIAPAVATLHETMRDISHGALGLERIVIGLNGRPIILETALGSALEQLLFSRERYWSELRIALPRMAGLPRFDQLTDITQLGAVTTALILGRQLTDEEYPAKVVDLVAGLDAVAVDGRRAPLAPAVKTWLQRALQLDPRGSFPSAVEARAALEKAVAESGYDASPDKAERLLARIHGKPAAAAPVPPAAPTPPASTAPVVPTASVRPQPAPAPVPRAESAASAHPVLGVQGQSPVREPFRMLAPASVASESPAREIEPVEDEPADVEEERPRARLRWKMVAAVFGAVAVLGGGATVAAMRFLAAPEIAEPQAVTGTLVLTSEPSGAEARIDGTVRGVTPLTLTLAAGPHTLRLNSPLADARSLRVTILAGRQVAQYVELGRTPVAPVAPTVETNVPAPAEVVAAVAPIADPSAPAAGWISVNARFHVRLFEAGQLLGSSETAKIMVPAGRHDLELVSDEIGYHVTRTAQVTAGKVVTLAVDAPDGTLSVNALPWAEVWIDGNKIGETPIGNLAVPVGSHEVVFKHPDLGERRQTVVVTLKNPARITADLNNP